MVGVKIKSRADESPLPPSPSGYKYLHQDAGTHVWFPTRGWRYVSRSVGGVVPGMHMHCGGLDEGRLLSEWNPGRSRVLGRHGVESHR